jgi:hypothetical protein
MDFDQKNGVKSALPKLDHLTPEKLAEMRKIILNVIAHNGRIMNIGVPVSRQ